MNNALVNKRVSTSAGIIILSITTLIAAVLVWQHWWIPEKMASPVTIEYKQKGTPKLTIELLKNAKYQHSLFGEKVKLKDGVSRSEGYPDYYIRIEEDNVVFGDLNNDNIEDAVVTLKSKPGGTSTFRYLAAIINQNGTPHNVATTLLGDRIKMHSITIQSGKIILDMTDWVKGLQSRNIVKFRLSGNKLVEEGVGGVRSPKQIVSDFYQCYLQIKNTGGVSASAKQCDNYLAEDYKQQLYNPEEMRLVDPILWAQDTPPTDNFQMHKILIEEKNASAIISFPPIWPSHKVKVYLILTENGWKISNIEDIQNGMDIYDLE